MDGGPRDRNGSTEEATSQRLDRRDAQLSRLRVFLGTLALLALAMGFIVLSYTSPFDPVEESWLTYAVRQTGGGLLVAAIGAALVQALVQRYREDLTRTLIRYIEHDLTSRLRDIREDIERQTDSLFRASASIEALGKAGVARVYGSRGAARGDMERELRDLNVRDIALMGISLNDFVRSDQQHSLHQCWTIITNYVRTHGRALDDGTRLRIRVLIIDPTSFGGQLRSLGESRTPDELAGRLDQDVSATSGHLNDIQRLAAATSGGRVSFEFRFYRLAPTLFLCRTDTVTYAQPYYFWQRREGDLSMPLLKFQGSPLHDALADHFELVWNASTPSRDILEGEAVGIDKGAYESGLVGVFTDSRKAYQRLLVRLRNAERRVYVQGISLRSFCEQGPLHAALREAVERDGLAVRLLLLDPNCEQARTRSFREHEFADHCAKTFGSMSAYSSSPACHEESTLHRHTWDSIRRLQALHSPDGSFEARLYESAPTCFLMIVDDTAFVEQYHFGKIIPEDYRKVGGTPPILGRDMALLEYDKHPTPDGLFDPDPLRDSVDLLNSHFDFVFQFCSRTLASAVSIDAPVGGVALLSPEDVS